MGSPHWPASVYRSWRIQDVVTCAHCGEPIDTRVSKTVDGRRNPAALALAHRVPLHEARDLGWSKAKIFSRDQSLPVHYACAARLLRSSTRIPVRDQLGGGQPTTPIDQVVESRW
jgi:hypothetical protein